MNRRFLALGAAVVLAGLIGLYVASRSDTPVDGASRSSVARNTEADSGKTVRTPVASPRPGATPTLQGSGTSATDYMVGDVRVRDHRSGNHPRVDVPPAVHPPEGRRISSVITSEIAQKVRAVMTECATRLSPDARGPSPRVDGTITVGIRDHLATIQRAVVQLRDVTGGDAVKQCIEDKSVGIAVPAGDEADVDGYAVTLSLRLP